MLCSALPHKRDINCGHPFHIAIFFHSSAFSFFSQSFCTSFRIPFTHSLTLSALIHMASLIHLLAKHHRFHPNHCLSIGIATTVAVAAQYFSAAAAAVGQIKFAPTLCGLALSEKGREREQNTQMQYWSRALLKGQKTKN